MKGQKCYTEKCGIERRGYPPGQHGPAHARRRKRSDYAVQLREKQKVKRIYGLHEKQFRILFERASVRDGITGENMLVALESRLDNVVFRMGFAPSRNAARQIVRHRHVEVGGEIVEFDVWIDEMGNDLNANVQFKIEVIPGQGAVIPVSRKTPLEITAVMNLD